jgi:hypothetical protein
VLLEFFIEKLTDEQSRNILDEDDIRQWGLENCEKHGWQ